jgi:DnaJ-class molecular chaperone
MYEEVITRCDYCNGTGVGEYVSEYGPFGFDVLETCHECEGDGTITKIIEIEYEEEQD